MWKKTFQTTKPSNFRTRLIEADYKKWNQCNFVWVTQASLEQIALGKKQIMGESTDKKYESKDKRITEMD